MYAKIKDGSIEKYPYTISDLKKDNPNVSFTKTIPTATLNHYGVADVVVAKKPTYNTATHNIRKKNEPELVSGVWTINWETIVIPQEDIDALKTEEQVFIRGERQLLLENSDWTVLPDAPLSTDMVNKYKTYRQELRDVTKQASFNNAEPSVTWPTEPT
tara:strand:- start:701 stop:1177 length:477 start_codon:yes stop_codon:yes gene_type:complete